MAEVAEHVAEHVAEQCEEWNMGQHLLSAVEGEAEPIAIGGEVMVTVQWLVMAAWWLTLMEITAWWLTAMVG